MSKLNDLIKEMCPNGVIYKNIKELCRENFWVMPSTPNYQNEGIPYITSKNIKNGKVIFDNVKYITENDYKSISSNRTIKENDFLISMIGTIGEVGIVKKEDLPFYGQNMYLLRLNVDLINIKYFYHYFTSSMVRNLLIGEKNNGNQGYLKTKNIEMLKVPVPPLEVQEEIVKILDKFGKLEAELEAELEARKSQYEFWRGNVFSSNNNLIKLDDVCNITAGGTPSKTHSEYWENGNIRWLGSTVCENKKGISEVTNYITELGLSKSSAKLLKPGTTLIAMVGATIGKVAYLDYEACTNQNVAGLFPKNINELDTSYLYHACRNLYSVFLDYANGKFSMASLGYIKNLKIPLPNINEQKRIAKLLDKFDTLINDISEGLPAEIELRRKQYEYYRNKLLNFEELKNE